MSKTSKTTELKVIDNSNLPKTLLQAKIRSQFLTIPQTTIDYVAFHQAIKATGKASYILTKLEHHEDGGLHIHMLVKLSEQQRISFLHTIIMAQEGTIGGLVNYQKPDNIPAVVNYLKKTESAVEGQPYLEYGQAPTDKSTKLNNTNDKDQALLELIQKAQQCDAEGAIEDYKRVNPSDYLKFKSTISETLKQEAAPKKLRYELPSFAPEDVKLNSKQKEVWDLLNSTPQTRRIIWVTGEYGSGKSFLYNYIKANHTHGMYDAGQSASLDNVVYGYDEEGVIAWDLPRTFDFETMGNAIASVIEKFSDFGQSITSKKYSGKTQHVRGHAIVFSNHPPLDQLMHRDIVHIDLPTRLKQITALPKTKPKYPTGQPEQATQGVDCARQSGHNTNIPRTSTPKPTLVRHPPKATKTIIRVDSDDDQDPDFEYWSPHKQQQYTEELRQRKLNHRDRTLTNTISIDYTETGDHNQSQNIDEVTETQITSSETAQHN